MEPLPRRTKLQRKYYATRTVSIFTRYCLLSAIAVFLIALSPVLLPLFAVVYVIFALAATIILGIVTLGLIFFADTTEGNILGQIWGVLDHMEEAQDALAEFASYYCTLVGGITLAVSILFLVLVNLNLGRSNKGADRARLIVAMVFCAIGVIIGAIMLASGGISK